MYMRHGIAQSGDRAGSTSRAGSRYDTLTSNQYMERVFVLFHIAQAPFPQFAYPAFHLPIWEDISERKTPHISLTILTRPCSWSFIRVLERPYRGINIPYWLVPYYHLNICPPVAPRHCHRDKNLTTLAKSHGCCHNSVSWVWPSSILQLGQIFLALCG